MAQTTADGKSRARVLGAFYSLMRSKKSWSRPWPFRAIWTVHRPASEYWVMNVPDTGSLAVTSVVSLAPHPARFASSVRPATSIMGSTVAGGPTVKHGTLHNV